MSGTIDGYQYDSSTTVSTDELYVDGILASPTTGPAEDLVRRADTATIYQLSNNGTYYAGSEYIVYTNASGAVVNTIGDNAAGSEWWESNTTVENSSHAASGGAQDDSERTIYGKDGTIYVNDFDPSGNDVAYATYSQSTGAELSSYNWAPAGIDNNYASNTDNKPGVGTHEVPVYSTVNVTDYGNPGGGPPPGNPDTVASNQKIDTSAIMAGELQTDFTSAAKLSNAIVKNGVASSTGHTETANAQASSLYPAGAADHLSASQPSMIHSSLRSELASLAHIHAQHL